jgi:hypothetical protein
MGAPRKAVGLGQLLKALLIVLIFGFVAVSLTIVVGWLVDAVVATRPAWLAGGLGGCLSAGIYLHRRWRRCRGAGLSERAGVQRAWSERAHGERVERPRVERALIERIFQSAPAVRLGAVLGAALTVVMIGFQTHEDGLALLGDEAVGAALAIVFARRAVPLLARLCVWRAERWLRRREPRRPRHSLQRGRDEMLRIESD